MQKKPQKTKNKKTNNTIHQVLFPGHKHLLTTGDDHPSLAGARAIIKVSGHQHRRLAGGYATTGHVSRCLTNFPFHESSQSVYTAVIGI